MPIRALQAMLGHANPKMTYEQYQHYYPGDEATYLDDYADTLLDDRYPAETPEQAPPLAPPGHP